MDGMIPMVFGLVITVLTVGFTIFVFARVFGGLSKNKQERERLLREGIQAGARLLAVQMGGMTMTVGVHRHLELQLQLEVQMQGRPPYMAMLTTMVSELQVPQLQPGAMLTIRVDRNDPMKVALEGVGSPQPQGYGGPPPMMGGAPNPYGGPSPYGGPGMYSPGMGGMGGHGMMPIGGTPAMPAGAKIGLWIGIGGALVGVIVAVVVVFVNVGGVGLGSASEGDGVCAQAVRCCEVVAAGKPSAANCKNLGKLGVPASACESSLKSFSDSAKTQGKTCH